MIELIKHAIRLHEDIFTRTAEFRGLISDQIFKEEYKTIHLNIGRRTGKTYSMMTLARKGDLIVVHNTATRDNLKRSYPDNLATIKTVQELYRDIISRRGFMPINNNFDYVWIDEPSLCLRQSIDIYNFDLLYRLVNANLFIKLGE